MKEDFTELRQVVMAVLRHWWLIVVIVSLAAGTGYTASQMQEPVYEATTSIAVGRAIRSTSLDRNDIQLVEQLAPTYVDLATRQPILQQTVEILLLSDSWQELRNRTQVVRVENTPLLEITVAAHTPDEAKVIADEIARQLILHSPKNLAQTSAEDKVFVEQRMEILKQKINAAQERLGILDTISTQSVSIQQTKELQNEIQVLEQLTVDWERNYAQLLNSIQEEIPVNHLTIVEPAQATLKPVRPRIQLNTVIAGTIGLVLALLLVFLFEHLDDTLKLTDDIGQLLGIPILGGISRMKGRGPQQKLLLNQGLFSRVSEDYRLLRSKLQYLSHSSSNGVTTLMITSPSGKEGRSTTVANLGVTMAQAGFKTIIVDADLRNPSLHKLFQISNEKGLSELLCSPSHSLDAYLTRSNHMRNLHILPSGTLLSKQSPGIEPHLFSGPSEWLGSQRMRQLLGQMMKMADMVIFDSPPAVAVADAAVLSGYMDGVVVMVEAKRTGRAEVREAIFNLQQAQANVLGLVFNRTSSKVGTTMAMPTPLPSTDKESISKPLPLRQQLVS